MTPWLSCPARFELTRCRPMAAPSACAQPSATKIAATRRSRASALINIEENSRGRSDHRVGLRIDQVHVAELGHEPHALAGAGGRGRVHPAAHLDAVHQEIDHGLHAHWLDYVERDVELLAVRPQIAAPLGDVLGPETEHQLAPDIG